MSYEVYATESFEKEIKKLSPKDKKALQKIFSQLKENPYVGDAIRFKFFREKRLREKRIYYLVYDDFCVVLLTAFGGKKAQQETINKILEMLPEFKEYIKKILGKN